MKLTKLRKTKSIGSGLDSNHNFDIDLYNFKIMSNNRQKGVIFIGLGRKPEFYEHIVQEEFKDSKNLELRAVGRAVPRAIQIA